MARNLLPIRILFHATYALVYLPIIVLGLTSLSLGDVSFPFVLNHFDGITALAALMGLGIFAALDILAILRNVNQRALLIAEIIVTVLMPLSMWPIILSSVYVIWPSWYLSLANKLCGAESDETVSWSCHTLGLIVLPDVGNEVSSASVISATVAIIALNVAFLLYISIAAVTDNVQGHYVLPIHLGDPPLSAPRLLKNWHLLGNQWTPTERATMVSHCTEYIFRNSVFRKHAFEPTVWAIFRGIITVYSCVGLVVFSAYSALSEAQLRQTLTVSETISVVAPYKLLRSTFGLSVASFLTTPKTPSDPNNFPMSLNPEQNPPPTLSVNATRNDWQNPTSTFWTTDGIDNFDISWTGEYSLLTWITSGTDRYLTASGPFGTGFFNSTQANLTNPLILAPFKQYDISLIGIEYILPDFRFKLWTPDFFTSVDSESGSNASMASFSFNGYQQQVLVRDLSPPSMFSSVVHVLSDIGGMLSFIDGLFALIFGRTIVAILFGTRIVSPFGLLGMVTHNRFKRLIHEQYPRMQEDIERGGMAAYISEVAIDAALVDTPYAKGSIGSAESSRIGDTEEGGENIELRRRRTGTPSISPSMSRVSELTSIDAALLDKPSATGHTTSIENAEIIELGRRQVGSSASYLGLPYIVEELGV